MIVSLLQCLYFTLCLFGLLFNLIFLFFLFLFVKFVFNMFFLGLEFRLLLSGVPIVVLVFFTSILNFLISVFSFSYGVEFIRPFNHCIRPCLHILSSKKLYFCLSDCRAALFYLLSVSLECVDSWIQSLSLVLWTSFLLFAIIYSLLRKIWSEL